MRRLLCLSLVLLAACTPPLRSDIDPMNDGPQNPPGVKSPIMSLSELEPLLRTARAAGRTLHAVGRSVFEGSRIEIFEVELLDIMKNYFAKRDLILARLVRNHPVIDKAGVIAGMSGSPIYVNGKIIGALAYSMGMFSKEPLIGVTPIEFMIADATRPSPQVGKVVSTDTVSPLLTPIYVAGISGPALEVLQKRLGKMNYLVVPAGSGSRVWDAPERFEEGSAIGAQLVTGDYDFTAVGTVTYVDKDLVVAFGHPYFGMGPIELPISTAIVHTVFAGLARSYKIASPGKVVGTLQQDRHACIAGRIGRMPRMIPVKVHLTNPKEGSDETIRCEVVDHPIWCASLLDMIVADSMRTWETSQGPHMVRSRLAMKFRGGRVLRAENVTFANPEAGYGQFGSGGSDVSDKIAQVFSNEWQRPELEEVSLESEHVNEVNMAAVKEAWPLTPEVDDGGTATLRVKFRRWRGPDATRDISIALPKGLKKGSEVTIEVGGGSDLQLDRPPASSLDELIDALQMEHRSTQLVASTSAEAYSILYKGKALERMPNSAVAELVPALESEAMLAPVSVHSVVDTDAVIVGRTSVKVKVK